MESCATHMLPPSILVLTLISPNSLMTGPGGSPVLPAGIIIFPGGNCPPLGGGLSLLLFCEGVFGKGVGPQKEGDFLSACGFTELPRFSPFRSVNVNRFLR